MSAQPGSPDWLRDAAARAWEEARLYAETAARFTLRPGRFARAWAEGAQQALNPLAMMATAAGLVGGAMNLIGRLFSRGGEGDASLLDDVLASGAPFAHYALLGVLCHALLKLTRTERRLRDSVAIALFAGAGPATLAALLVDATAAALWLHAGRPAIGKGGLFAVLHGFPHQLLASISFAGLLAFLAAFALAMSALHQRRLWITLLALAVTLLLAGVLFGLLPTLPFGTRLIISLHPFNWALWVD